MKKRSTTYLSFISIIIILTLSGCSYTKITSPPHSTKNITTGKPAYKGNIKARIKIHYQHWQGTPYKLGGLSKQGIDCSGFVNVTYRDVFGMKIPRSTELQSNIGRKISQQNLKTGDLIFF